MMNCLPIFRKYSEEILKHYNDNFMISDSKKLYDEFSHIFIYLANEETHFIEINDVTPFVYK